MLCVSELYIALCFMCVEWCTATAVSGCVCFVAMMCVTQCLSSDDCVYLWLCVCTCVTYNNIIYHNTLCACIHCYVYLRDCVYIQSFIVVL